MTKRIFLTFLAVLLAWAGYAFLILPTDTQFLAYRQFGSWNDAGAFGDSFGVFSCLFSALAFGGVLSTILKDTNRNVKRLS